MRGEFVASLFWLTARDRPRRGLEAVRARITALLRNDPELPAGGVWRRLHEEGTPPGLSTVYWVLAGARATLQTALMVRFEGAQGSSRNWISDRRSGVCGYVAAIDPVAGEEMIQHALEWLRDGQRADTSCESWTSLLFGSTTNR